MASLKQIQANRRNAQKSTGPRSAAGKAASSMNALSSGIDAQATIIRGEDPAALSALTAEFLAEHRPVTATERALVDTLITCEWFLRRLRATEAQFWEASLTERMREDSRAENSPLAFSFATAPTGFTRLWRRMDSLTRRFQETLHELRRVRAARAALHPAEPVDPAPVYPQNGFVPHPAPDSQPPAPVQPPVPTHAPEPPAPDLRI